MSDLRSRRGGTTAPSTATPEARRPLLSATDFDAEGAVVVHLRGRLDATSVHPVEREVRALLALPITSVTVDLGGVTFGDRAGLRTLARLREAAEEHGVRFALRPRPESA
jgi:anti-anti-sigma factor